MCFHTITHQPIIADVIRLQLLTVVSDDDAAWCTFAYLLTHSRHHRPLLTWGPVGQRAWSQFRQQATPTYTTTVNSCSNKWPSPWLWHCCVSEKTTKLLLHPFNGLFSRTTWVSWYQKSKTSLDLNEARDNGVLGCSGISWITCKQYAPRSRQITTPTPHHSISTGQMLFLPHNQRC